MVDPVRTAVIHYSSTGTVHALAEAVAAGAESAGGEVRLLRCRELAPQSAIDANPRWKAHAEAVSGLPEATVDDIEWADVLLLGSPTRFGAMASQLKQLIDECGPLWAQGKLVDKVLSAFTAAATDHGGHETTLTGIYNVGFHWGCIVVSPGYADEIQQETGTPYGTSHVSRNAEVPPGTAQLEAARFQGRRAVRVAAALASARQAV